LHERAPLSETHRRVLVLCYLFAASLDLYAAESFDLAVPNLVDLIHPLTPDLVSTFGLGADWQDSGDNQQGCNGDANGASVCHDSAVVLDDWLA
jgi:hypothetical protein